MIPFTVPEISWSGFLRFCGAFLRRKWSIGPEIQELEQRIAAQAGVKYAVSFASARYALYLLFRYFKCENKRVLIPAYTCIPTADSVRWSGAIPHFTDIDLVTYNQKYEKSFRSLENVGAICLSYLYGLVGDPAQFLNWAKDAGIPVIEDAAIAFGARIKGRPAGSLGDAAVFSLQSSKIISAWRGGVVATNDSALNQFLLGEQIKQPSPRRLKIFLNGCIMMARRLAATPIIYRFTFYYIRQATLIPPVARLLSRFLNQNPAEAVTGESDREMPASERTRFTRPQAILALSSLQKLDLLLGARRRNAALLSQEIEKTGIEFCTMIPGFEHAYGRYPVRIPGVEKKSAAKIFADAGVEVGTNYPYIVPETVYCKDLGNARDAFPNAKHAARETILLPMHTSLRNRDMARITKAIRTIWIAQKRRNEA